jgi:hypothetical protein
LVVGDRDDRVVEGRFDVSDAFSFYDLLRALGTGLWIGHVLSPDPWLLLF